MTRPNDKPISKWPSQKQRLALNHVASDSSDESESCEAINFTVELLSIEKATQRDIDQNHLVNEFNDLKVLEHLQKTKTLKMTFFSWSEFCYWTKVKAKHVF